MSQETDWEAAKAEAQADLEVALALGFPVGMAKRIARWNPTYEYATFNDMQFVGTASSTGPRQAVAILFSRSASRVNVGVLDGAQLDEGVQYAIFIPDVPDLQISQISFKLNNVPIHTEFSEPWDYAGTAFDGSSTRVSFSAGDQTIEAEIISPFGNFSVESNFNVE